jgi:hypothetical protein
LLQVMTRLQENLLQPKTIRRNQSAPIQVHMEAVADTGAFASAAYLRPPFLPTHLLGSSAERRRAHCFLQDNASETRKTCHRRTNFFPGISD